jgi:hypothetical protein
MSMQILSSIADVTKIGKGPKKPLGKDYRSVKNLAAHMVQYLRDWWADPEQDGSSEFRPMVIAVCKNGDIVPIVVDASFDEDNKDAFVEQCRTMFKVWGVERYVFTSEAWLAESRQEDTSRGVPKEDMPSQREDRLEVTIVTAIERGKSVFTCLEMIRDWDTGKVNELREMKEIFGAPVSQLEGLSKGRFSTMLEEPVAPEVPDNLQYTLDVLRVVLDVPEAMRSDIKDFDRWKKHGASLSARLEAAVAQIRVSVDQVAFQASLGKLRTIFEEVEIFRHDISKAFEK